MNQEEFNKEVLKEATLLREHATNEQKDKLDFSTLDGEQPDLCIYGQMTGNCFSINTSELLAKCAIPLLPDLADTGSEFDEIDIEVSIDGFIRNNSSRQYFSAIEGYICLVDSDNVNLIKYIKKEIDTFVP